MGGRCSWPLAAAPCPAAEAPSHVCPQVTQHQKNVLDLKMLEVPDVSREELEASSKNMLSHVKRLVDERDEYREVCLQGAQQPGGTGGEGPGVLVMGHCPHPHSPSQSRTPPRPLTEVPQGQDVGTLPEMHSYLRITCIRVEVELGVVLHSRLFLSH